MAGFSILLASVSICLFTLVIYIAGDVSTLKDKIEALEARVASLESTQCVCEEPEPETFPDTGRDVDGGIFYPGIRRYINIDKPGVVFRGPLDYNGKLYPAIEAMGSVVVNGSLLIERDVLLRVHDTVINLTHFVVTQQLQSQENCVNPCPATGLREPLTCVCKCLPGWQGEACDIPKCANGGLLLGSKCQCVAPFDPSTNCQTVDCGDHGYPNGDGGCVCDFGYQGSPCTEALDLVIDDCHCVDGQCIRGKCYCNNGRLGPQCEYQCVDPRLTHFNASECPFKSNIGDPVDCFHTGSEIACICGGGGYTYESIDQFVVGVLTCDDSEMTTAECQQQFVLERTACCSPGGKCEFLLQEESLCGVNDNACCSALSSQGMEICLNQGCSYCDYNGISTPSCVSRLSKYEGCITKSTTSFDGKWSYHVYVTDNEDDVSISARDTWLSIYKPCMFSQIGSPCFWGIEAEINNTPWPTLDVGEYTKDVVQTPFVITFPGASVMLGMAPGPRSRAAVVYIQSKEYSNSGCITGVSPILASPVKVVT